MKHLILICLVSLLFAGSTRAQQPCQTMGQKNPHGMMMTVSKVTVLDTVNFTVTSVKSTPFMIMPNDTIWFNVCITPRDGQQHSTQIRYTTDMGVISYNITMTAPTAGVNESYASSPVLAIYPNPAVRTVNVALTSSAAGTLEVYSMAGDKVLSIPTTGAKQIEVPVAGLPNGAYILRLMSKGVMVSQTHFAIAH